MRTFTGRAFHMERVEKTTIEDVRLERCTFDNCGASEMTFRRVEVIDGRIWACHLRKVVLEDVLVDGLRMTIEGGGGKRDPLMPLDLFMKHVVLRGTIGSLICNPDTLLEKDWHAAERRSRERARKFYEGVDWALDISQARFTSGPSFRLGPPAHLIRRDPLTQPVVTRERAAKFDWNAIRDEVGVWWVVLMDLLEQEWPDEVVLIPAWGKTGERDRAGIQRLREMGVAG